MLSRVLEPEVMDTLEDAEQYNLMDHSSVNQIFAEDFFSQFQSTTGRILDVGTGTALIPILIAARLPECQIVGIDMASEMLKLGQANILQAGLTHRICLELVNARGLPYANGSFDAVISNSIIHHLPDPFEGFAEMARVTSINGLIFVRDLLRPATDAELQHLVQLYAADANDYQRSLFSDSLRAALTLSEVQTLVAELGFAPDTVKQTSDRHWTWANLNTE